jgi:hypothetical protein
MARGGWDYGARQGFDYAWRCDEGKHQRCHPERKDTFMFILNNHLVYMSHALAQEVFVQPGLESAMCAEFVAQDHCPFYPRDVAPAVFFTVAPAT